MKTKSLLLTALATLGLTAASLAQNNCDLINSATFSVPSGTQTLQGFHLPCVNNNNPPNNAGTNVNVSLPLNQWSYVALTKSSTNACNLYLNGQTIFTGSYANISYSWSKLILGAQLFGGSYSNYFNGYIDEVRISNSVRTAAEISNYYNSSSAFTSDANTIGLWHFNQSSGTTVNGTVGNNGTTNASWSNGIFGNCLQYNGTSSHTDFIFSTPTTNSTIEFWIKPNTTASSWPVMTNGGNSAGLLLNPFTTSINYTWSTGATGNSLTVNPTTLPYIWVTDGNCTDTIWFNSQSATIYDTTYVTVTDTTIVTINDTLLTTVTDTLVINTTLSLPAPNNENTILIYPNPASDHITIDNGNYLAMAGYSIKIENNAGQQVFQSAVNQPQFYIDLSTWSGNGLYFVHLIDPQNNTVTVRKIVLQ
jgi:hypothetical protein